MFLISLLTAPPSPPSLPPTSAIVEGSSLGYDFSSNWPSSPLSFQPRRLFPLSHTSSSSSSSSELLPPDVITSLLLPIQPPVTPPPSEAQLPTIRHGRVRDGLARHIPMSALEGRTISIDEGLWHQELLARPCQPCGKPMKFAADKAIRQEGVHFTIPDCGHSRQHYNHPKKRCRIPQSAEHEEKLSQKRPKKRELLSCRPTEPIAEREE